MHVPPRVAGSIELVRHLGIGNYLLASQNLSLASLVHLKGILCSWNKRSHSGYVSGPFYLNPQDGFLRYFIHLLHTQSMLYNSMSLYAVLHS